MDDGDLYYLVKWLGWPVTESTWEPECNLQHLEEIIKVFKNSKKP